MFALLNGRADSVRINFCPIVSVFYETGKCHNLKVLTRSQGEAHFGLSLKEPFCVCRAIQDFCTVGQILAVLD